MTEPFHDFDPYMAMEQMSQLMKEIADAHNSLVNDYLALKKRVRYLEHRIHMLEQQGQK